MRYYDDNHFTKEQIRIAKNIARNIKKLKDTGCVVVGHQWNLYAYLQEDVEHSHPLHHYGNGSGLEVPYLNCGDIDDSGADDTLYFEEGYIPKDLI